LECESVREAKGSAEDNSVSQLVFLTEEMRELERAQRRREVEVQRGIAERNNELQDLRAEAAHLKHNLAKASLASATATAAAALPTTVRETLLLRKLSATTKAEPSADAKARQAARAQRHRLGQALEEFFNERLNGGSEGEAALVSLTAFL
jgi:hypothetical protein